MCFVYSLEHLFSFSFMYLDAHMFSLLIFGFVVIIHDGERLLMTSVFEDLSKTKKKLLFLRI